MNWLGIPEELHDSAILSLTHRSMLNTDDNLDGDKLLHYHNVGKNVCVSLLMRYYIK